MSPDRILQGNQSAARAGLDPSDQSDKRRAACEECRTKRIKCQGEQPSCSRCVRECITCVYSPQKQMGRPKKRQRAEQDAAVGTLVNGATQQQTAWEGVLSETEYEITYTPGGSLQPWQLPENWGDFLPGDGIMPAQRPDRSSDQTPMLNFPPEPQATQVDIGTNGNSFAAETHGSTNVLIDPSLTGVDHACLQNALPECACLSSIYLTLNTLQTMDPSIAFPFALHPLREAMQTASAAISCEECPKRFISGMTNVQLIGTLLLAIAERFGKVLEAISVESTRAELAGETKKFRLADLNTENAHLHAGGLGCAAAFSLQLSPGEWRTMCKKVVRAEVHGPSDGNECCCYLLGITAQMTERQEKFHRAPPVPGDAPRDIDGNLIGGRHHVHSKEDYQCLRLVEYAKNLVEGYDWTRTFGPSRESS